jgi:hypothetical protein
LSGPTAPRFCIRCGGARAPGAHFCTACGADLSAQDAMPAAEPAPVVGAAATAFATQHCPACGAEQPLEHVFCTVCGGSLRPAPEPEPIPTPWVRADGTHPVRLIVRRQPRQSRLGALLRLPPAAVAAAAAIVCLAAAIVAALLAWPARLATGRYPRALRAVAAAGLGFAARASCYACMLSPAFPFSRPDPAVQIELPEVAGRPWLRLPALVPVLPLLVLEVVVAIVCAPVAWAAVVGWGRLPDGMADVMEQPQRYGLRFWAYALLLSDSYPWFQPERESAPPPALTAPSGNVGGL